MKTKLDPEFLTAAENARRLLLMLEELHKLGYESLRATPYLSASGCNWRCCIVPAFMTRPDHGALLADDVVYEALPRYSSAEGDDYFGWANMKPKTPLILARRFIVEFPNFAEQGKQADPAYVRWFAEMLKETAPHGVIYAFADEESPKKNRMLTSFCDPRIVVRLPPAGAPK